MLEGQENIPHLMNDLIPQASFFTQVVNHGILGHYVATASLATGVYETFNNFAAVSPESPTVFEYFRKDLKRPSSDAWVVAPSDGFNRIGESSHRSYGHGFGARVILPKRLLAAATSRGNNDYQHLLRDNYETPYFTPELVGSEFELQQLETILKLSVDDFKTHAQTLSSPDELSVYIARQLMRQVAPTLLWITLHDIDVAHAGAYSLYVDGIRRCDRLCAEMWKTIQTEPEYASNTTLLYCPISAATPTTTLAATDFSIIAPATRFLAQHGCSSQAPELIRAWSSTEPSIPWIWCPHWAQCWALMLRSRRENRSTKSYSVHAALAISNPRSSIVTRRKRARSSSTISRLCGNCR